MFGRRTPDRPNSTPSAPHKAELDLGMLDELPELITAKAPAPQPAPQPPRSRPKKKDGHRHYLAHLSPSFCARQK